MMTVTPRDITIPADQTAYFCWRNTGRDYPVDVWLSYGGGYTDLAPGATWNEGRPLPRAAPARRVRRHRHRLLVVPVLDPLPMILCDDS
jgi:hypothetical protein